MTPDGIEPMLARLKILKHWIRGRRNGVSLQEMMLKQFDRSFTIKAKSVIKRIRPSGTFWEVWLRGFSSPLYYPREISLTSLYQVVAEVLYDKDWHYYEKEQTKVGEDDVVVDCGAGEGLFSLTVANRCYKVYAIEPLSRFVESMKLTFAGFRNVEIVQCALSDYQGIGCLSNSGISSSLLADRDNGLAVQIDTLDGLFLKNGIKIDYIKADLEGSEMEMLHGALGILRRFGPKIAITTYHNCEHTQQISNFLRNANTLYRISLRGLHADHGSFVMLHANTK